MDQIDIEAVWIFERDERMEGSIEIFKLIYESVMIYFMLLFYNSLKFYLMLHGCAQLFQGEVVGSLALIIRYTSFYNLLLFFSKLIVSPHALAISLISSFLACSSL